MNEQLTLLDRLIGWLSPEAGVRRAEFRMEMRSYDAARIDPQGGNWFPINTTPEQTDAPHRNLVRARMRDLERNGDVTEGVIGAMLRNVIGTGFVLEAQVCSARGKTLDVINDRIEEIWKEWSLAENCDVTGDSSFSEILEMVMRRHAIDGEIFIVKVVDPDGYLPFKLQLLEPDMLACDRFQYGANYVFGGIEVDKYMKAVAYHFRPDPLPYFLDQTIVRIPRENVIHIFTKKRPQQTRSLSDMAVCTERVRNIQEYIGNELEAARNAAAITAFVVKEKGASGPGIGNPVGGKGDKTKRYEEIRRGQYNVLSKNDDIRFPTLGRPNVNAAGFTSFLIRLIAMACGLSYETVSRDMSQVNYSSHRGGQLEDRKTYTKMQKRLVAKLCDRVYEWFLEAAVMSGKLALPRYFEDERARRRYAAHKWSTPGWKWVDPQKEASGMEKMLALGITTLSDICGEQGKDYYEVMKQRKKEIDEARELGIELPWFSGKESTSAEEYNKLMNEEDNPPSKKEGENEEETS